MYVRLAFSVAAHLDPEILLLDEVLAVGDQAFQQKCLARIDQITQSGRTVLFVSHDVSSISRLCRRAVLVQDGRIAYEGSAAETIERYLGTRPHLVGGGHLAAVDRSGTGALRFCNVRIAGADGGSTLLPDGPVDIEVEFAGVRSLPARDLQVTVSVSSPVAGTMATLSTRFQPDGPFAYADLGHGSTITCHIDELPLRPGRYFLSLSLDSAGEVIDRVVNQVEFTVLPADFHGGGVPAGEGDGPLLVRHRWNVGRVAATGAAAS
jgi:lipopolysaccharide transport system ATP-binding protein